MSGDGDGDGARAMVDAWRRQHADRADPLRLAFIDALASRAAAHEGQVRRILDARLSELLAAYAEDLDKAPAEPGNGDGDGDGDGATAPRAAAGSPLGGLLAHIGARAPGAGEVFAADAPGRAPAAFPQLPALDAFRKTWDRLRSDSQLRQSLEQLPLDAGPLNSGVLVQRSITLMREVSPGYLQHFLSYVDTLSWLEQLRDGGGLAAVAAPRAAIGARKPARSRTRKRRD
ncbi:DUF2894 domain-containing protein [Xanthomonas sp. AmX2]|uniref:DUF2894 domain-containing protein n=1 Tax=Xanthomonas sp. TaxID=29446 RepID=UPI001980C908|nr:DUF2894 domain-containing protein [Xanthomonas sp.]MBN6149971.1 DUF2894 domain-containing protein [Xanthomonas sp.]